MNDIPPGEKPMVQPKVMQQAGKKQGNGLKFPSVAIMGIAVFLVVLMMLILGWKIVNLENEKARLDTERRLLERDKSAYAKILEELPDLEDRKQNLLREVEELKGEVQSNQSVLASLKNQQETSLSRLNKAQATDKQLQAEITAAQATLANINKIIAQNRPISVQLSQEVALLQQQEQQLLKVQALHTGQTVDKITNDTIKEKWFNAQDAVRYGIVDGIIDPQIETSLLFKGMEQPLEVAAPP